MEAIVAVAASARPLLGEGDTASASPLVPRRQLRSPGGEELLPLASRGSFRDNREREPMLARGEQPMGAWGRL